jgi:hypothetical protein
VTNKEEAQYAAWRDIRIIDANNIRHLKNV